MRKTRLRIVAPARRAGLCLAGVGALVFAGALAKFLAERHGELLGGGEAGAFGDLVDFRARFVFEELLGEREAAIADVLVRAFFKRVAEGVFHPAA